MASIVVAKRVIWELVIGILNEEERKQKEKQKMKKTAICISTTSVS